MTQPLVTVSGDEGLTAGLRRAMKDQDKAAAKAARDTARQVRDWARSAAAAGTPAQQKMASGIGSRGSKDRATLTVRNTKSAPGATTTFWGAKRRTGWYAAPRFRDTGKRQFPKWVGASWQVAAKGQGPYVINDTLADRRGEIEALWLDRHAGALFKAVPSRPRG